MTNLAIIYTINLNSAQVWLTALAAGLALLGWTWGALLKSALGLSRWFGLLMLIPVVNVLAFIASGVAAHLRQVERQNEPAFEKIKRLEEE